MIYLFTLNKYIITRLANQPNQCIKELLSHSQNINHNYFFHFIKKTPKKLANQKLIFIFTVS